MNGTVRELNGPILTAGLSVVQDATAGKAGVVDRNGPPAQQAQRAPPIP
jgi:hypothetical protein